MTLYINELSFDRAKIFTSPDTLNVVRNQIHGSNFPELQKSGVSDSRIKIVLTVNTSDVNDVVAQLRGTLRNHEFALIRTTDQHIRDNKKSVFVKVNRFNPTRKTGHKYLTEIEIDCDYVGTQASHKMNYFVNSIVVPNDWKKMGTTGIALPRSSYAVDEVVDETYANHPFVRTPTWASGETSATYDEEKVYRGTVGFNIKYAELFDNTINVYDGELNVKKIVTDTDHEFSWDNGKMYVRQPDWCEMEFDKGSGVVVFKKYEDSQYKDVATLSLSSGDGFGDIYLLAKTSYYVRFVTDKDDEFELFLNKIPSFLPSDSPPQITTSGISSGSAASGNTYNFINLKSGLYIAGNREFSVDDSGYITNTNSDAKNVQYWFGWETTDTGMDVRAKDVLRRLE